MCLSTAEFCDRAGGRGLSPPHRGGVAVNGYAEGWGLVGGRRNTEILRFAQNDLGWGAVGQIETNQVCVKRSACFCSELQIGLANFVLDAVGLAVQFDFGINSGLQLTDRGYRHGFGKWRTS